jgi:hypothetical protein
MVKEGNDKHTAGPSEGSNENSVATSVTPFKQAKEPNQKGSNDNSVATSVTPAKQAKAQDLKGSKGFFESDTESEEEVEEDAPGVEDLCLKVCQQYLESKQEERVQGQALRYGESQYDDAEESSAAASLS